MHFRPKYLLSLYFITVTVGVFLLAHPSGFTYLFVPKDDPANSKWILFTAGMVGDYSGFSTLYIYILYMIYMMEPKLKCD